MRCPKCGLELQTVKHRGVEVDTCFACGGVFLDKGELEAVAQPEKRGVLDDVMGWLKKK